MLRPVLLRVAAEGMREHMPEILSDHRMTSAEVSDRTCSASPPQSDCRLGFASFHVGMRASYLMSWS